MNILDKPDDSLTNSDKTISQSKNKNLKNVKNEVKTYLLMVAMKEEHGKIKKQKKPETQNIPDTYILKHLTKKK